MYDWSARWNALGVMGAAAVVLMRAWGVAGEGNGVEVGVGVGVGVPAQTPLHISHEETDTSTPTLIITPTTLLSSLSTLQESFFSLYTGTYPSAIDWTAAVLGTHVAAALGSLSVAVGKATRATCTRPTGSEILEEDEVGKEEVWKREVEKEVGKEEVERYFTHLTTTYYTQDAFSLRLQAYDDMLWVVLGWLDASAFVEGHSGLHYPPSPSPSSPSPSPPSSPSPPREEKERNKGGTWHATQLLPPFSHRARIFYELASNGWNEELCGGGMLWAPRGRPYKNAITNELWIAASVGMYLGWRGDGNCEPFASTSTGVRAVSPGQAYDCEHEGGEPGGGAGGAGGPFNPIYLTNALLAYDWLASSGMRTPEGLYADGFHVSEGGTKCDERDDSVWTYNQGVILSGLRGLWEATGNTTYLDDGHELVDAVRAATGWHGETGPLGTSGILTEPCDPDASCSQDAQGFKGIFMHHLTAFCAPLPRTPRQEGKTFAAGRELRRWHGEKCRGYRTWVTRNVRAAMGTRDAEGRFGGWWGGGKDGQERGRGRTVETMGAGVAVLRAAWEFGRLEEGEGEDGW